MRIVPLVTLITLAALPAVADLPAPKTTAKTAPVDPPAKPPASTGEATETEAPAAPVTPEQEVENLLKQRKLKSYEAAYEKASALLKKDPTNLDTKLLVVRALNGIMRIKTTGNLVLPDSTSDTPKNKKLWAKYGPEAEKLAKEVFEARPKSTMAALMFTEAYMFHASSFGILKAFFAGAAGQFEKNGDHLIKHAEKADDAVGYIYRGSLFLIAPWPVGNKDKAKEAYAKSIEVAPKSVRNHYYVGVAAYRRGEMELAKKEFTFAVENKCTSGTEREFCWKIKEAAKDGLAKIAKK